MPRLARRPEPAWRLSESLLRRTVGRGIDAADALVRIEERLSLARLYSDSYARYCWPVNSLADIRLRALPPAFE